jgi:hypothetical protein
MTWQLFSHVATENYQIAPYPLFLSSLHLFPATMRLHSRGRGTVSAAPPHGGVLGLLLHDGGAMPAAPPHGGVLGLLLCLNVLAPPRGKERTELANLGSVKRHLLIGEAAELAELHLDLALLAL